MTKPVPFSQKLQHMYPMPHTSYTWQAQCMMLDLDSGKERLIKYRLQHEKIEGYLKELEAWQRRVKWESTPEGAQYAKNNVIVLETIIARLVQARLEHGIE